MKCPNCGAEDPTPESTDNGTTTCPRCGHRFPIEYSPPEPSRPARKTPAPAQQVPSR